MKKYELSESVISNLMIFLDRTSYKGLKEHQALNEIIHALQNPLEDNKKNTKANKK